MILFICYYNGITRLNYVKSRLTLVIWSFLKSQAISFQIDFNSCFPFYSDKHFCYLHPIARTSYGTNDTSRNVTGYSNQNTHAPVTARMTHHATSQDILTKTRTHNFPRKFLIWLFETIIDCLYHFCCAQSEHSCYMSVITMLRSIIHLNLK